MIWAILREATGKYHFRREDRGEVYLLDVGDDLPDRINMPVETPLEAADFPAPLVIDTAPPRVFIKTNRWQALFDAELFYTGQALIYEEAKGEAQPPASSEP